MYWRAFPVGSRNISVRFYICKITRCASDILLYRANWHEIFFYYNSSCLQRVGIVKCLTGVNCLIITWNGLTPFHYGRIKWQITNTPVTHFMQNISAHVTVMIFKCAWFRQYFYIKLKSILSLAVAIVVATASITLLFIYNLTSNRSHI